MIIYRTGSTVYSWDSKTGKITAVSRLKGKEYAKPFLKSAPTKEAALALVKPPAYQCLDRVCRKKLGKDDVKKLRTASGKTVLRCGYCGGRVK